eukprot:TRINITY_DN11109_c0_g2_i1.p1 TRINITY_DN11109_c0_g2~~TRINITY_DN11109_c0_g2_i1.p1  ORF type:complete len:286 (+),score=17.75 TRINITY_DN11109_c0_g2_i1:318-1175(+)
MARRKKKIHQESQHNPPVLREPEPESAPDSPELVWLDQWRSQCSLVVLKFLAEMSSGMTESNCASSPAPARAIPRVRWSDEVPIEADPVLLVNESGTDLVACSLGSCSDVGVHGQPLRTSGCDALGISDLPASSSSAVRCGQDSSAGCDNLEVSDSGSGMDLQTYDDIRHELVHDERDFLCYLILDAKDLKAFLHRTAGVPESLMSRLHRALVSCKLYNSVWMSSRNLKRQKLNVSMSYMDFMHAVAYDDASANAWHSALEPLDDVCGRELMSALHLVAEAVHDA